MNASGYIAQKQKSWARRNGKHLIGSQGNRGAKMYTPDLMTNLFLPLSEETYESFRSGDGNELGNEVNPGKMQALHSSSALGVNVFEYWKQNGEIATIAAACGLCRKGSTAPREIFFEEKYPIDNGFGKPPNIDVVIHNDESSGIKRLAIECKFTEAYGSYTHGGLKQKYLTGCDDLWADIPQTRKLAEAISPDDGMFVQLHAAQLIKHILGLKRNFGKKGFRLLYLWYDVPGDEGARHHREVESFSNVAKRDGLLFHELTYQQLIMSLSNTVDDKHARYADWLVDRYL